MDTILLIVMIILMLAIIAALALFLGATILELFKINAGLSVVLPLVGQIIVKTNPVNPVVDDINANLVVARNALEGLMLKKAGPDSAGLVESLFPGQGAQFLRRVGRSGKVVNVGTVYTRGVGILASLGRGAPIGAAHAKGPAVRDAQYSTTAASMLYPRPGGDPKARPKSPVVGSNAPRQYEAALTPGQRARDAAGKQVEPTPVSAPAMPASRPPQPSGQVSYGKSPPPAPDKPPPPAPKRLSAKGSRPWER